MAWMQQATGTEALHQKGSPVSVKLVEICDASNLHSLLWQPMLVLSKGNDFKPVGTPLAHVI